MMTLNWEKQECLFVRVYRIICTVVNVVKLLFKCNFERDGFHYIQTGYILQIEEIDFQRFDVLV